MRRAYGFLVSILGTCGCAGAELQKVATTDSTQSIKPRAPGVAIERLTQWPQARSAAAHGTVVALTAPLDKRRAVARVAQFFDAVIAEDFGELALVLADGAVFRPGLRARTRLAAEAWRRRLSELDYGALAGRMVYHEADIETYTRDELAALTPVRTHRLRPGTQEVLVVVRILSRGEKGKQLFGPVIQFVLRQRGGPFQIREIYEDFRVP